MKKIFIVALAIIAVLCAVVALCACNHQHDYGEWIEAVEATCSHAGNIGHYHCAECGKNFDKDHNEIEGSVTTEKLAHEWDAGEIILQPTCTSEGELKRSCLNCGAKQTVAIDKLPHTVELIPAVAPNCEEAGSGMGQKCAVCGTVLSASATIPPLGHDYGEWETLIASTDEHSGVEMHTCSRCGKAETRDTAQGSHVWGAWVDNGDGTHTRICQNSSCDNKVDTQSCVYDSGAVTAATCTTDGFTLYTCLLCSHELKGEQVTALGHNYGEFTADFVGVENFENHTHTHSRVCKRCGDKDTQPCADTTEEIVVPTCTTGGYTKQTCNTCGSIHETNPVQALGHQFDEWAYDTANADMHTHTCQTCLTVERQPCVYNDAVTQPTCTDGGFTTHTCSICQHFYIDAEVEAYGHAFSDFVYNGNGETNTHTHTCARCQLSETKDCEMVSVTLAETCTTDGSTTSTCKYCFISFTSQGAKSLGHDYTDFADAGNGNHSRSCRRCSTVDTQPHAYETSMVSAADCENARVDEFTCTVCSSFYTESVGSALGHSWAAWTVSTDKHTHVCQRNDQHTEAFAHVYTTTNLCNDCSYDCLNYMLVGGHYVVYNDNRLPSSVTTVIIASQHSEIGGDMYDVTQINESAFSFNRYIKTVQLPATLTTIGTYAFYHCASLTTVTVEGGSALVEIGYSAFSNCSELVSFSLQEGLVTIGEFAFANCVKLLEIDVPASVQSLGTYAFRNTACYNDENRWTNGVLYLGKHLVGARAEVVGDYALRDDTISIGCMAFSECNGLTGITLPSSLTYVDRDAFLGCEALASVIYAGTMNDWFAITFVSDASSPLYYAARLNIVEASGAIEIPDGITSIPAGTFRGTAITSVHIPETVTFIGEEAFENCEQLTVVNVPDSVKYIGANAFKGCGYYNETANWDSGVLYIGNHLIASKPSELSGEYRLKDGTLTIGIDAFRNCTELTQVTIVDTVVRIGAYAFEGCTGLTGVIFEDTSIRWLANRVNSISRMLSANDLSTGAKAAEQFEYYNGEWKRWN